MNLLLLIIGRIFASEVWGGGGGVGVFVGGLTKYYRNFAVYLKIPIINPGLIFVHNAFLVGLFSEELIF